MKTIAQNVIHIIGGHRAVADVLNIDISRVYRMTYPKERGGTGGIIPAEHQQALMNYALEKGIPLKAEHFFETPETNIHIDPPNTSVSSRKTNPP